MDAREPFRPTPIEFGYCRSAALNRQGVSKDTMTVKFQLTPEEYFREDLAEVVDRQLQILNGRSK